jgi:salicylate hydroxylase
MADVKDLHISIIGAGMGGLAAALALSKKGFPHVDVYETASNLGFVGAGIQLAPNLVRVLDRLDCWSGTDLERDATHVQEASIRDGATNRELAHVPMPDIKEKYGFPHCTGHRASLAGGLYEACKKEAGVQFHFGQSLKEITSFGNDSGKVSFIMQSRDGQTRTIETDILLGADGIKSTARQSMLQHLDIEAQVEDTGQAAYRIMLPLSQMSTDPDLLALLQSDGVKRWIGEKRHIIAYPIANHTIYNLSTCQPDQNFAMAPSATYTTKGDKGAMKAVFADFCPLVQKMLDMVPEGEVCEWRLRSHRPLPAWTEGAVALLGDACHPTLPHLNQGAAMAIEDAAVLAEVIARARAGADHGNGNGNGNSNGDANIDTAKALRVYELLRKDRTSTLVDLAAFSGRTLHLGEGKAKEERDRQFAAAREQGKPVPDKWASPDVQKMIYEYDCVEEARRRFDELYDGLR